MLAYFLRLVKLVKIHFVSFKDQMFHKIEDINLYLENYLKKHQKHSFKYRQGVKNLKEFLKLVGNPQNQIPTIHVSGTSGKGSTISFLERLFISAGYKTGGHTSPYLTDFRELFLISGKKLSQKKTCEYFSEFEKILRLYIQNQKPLLSYFEITTAFSFFVFSKEKPEVLLIETGLGGKYDATNCQDLKNKICLINQIGYDHQEILGNSISEIASHKAGIIHSGNPVFTVDQEFQESLQVIQNRCRQTRSSLKTVGPKGSSSKNFIDYRVIKSDLAGNTFELSIDLGKGKIIKKMQIPDLGLHQVSNFCLALAGFLEFQINKKVKVDWEKISKLRLHPLISGRLSFYLPGQLHYKLCPNLSPIVLDGAHNNQKILSLRNFIVNHFFEKFVTVVAFTDTRDPTEMLKVLSEFTEKFIFTEFNIFNQKSSEFAKISIKAEKLPIFNSKNIPYEIFQDNAKALDRVWNFKQPILITGSLYLLSNYFNNQDLKIEA